ncbi:MAG: hypothetical protein AAFV49_10280 [Pseudomonadota bacterium]
MADSLKGIGPQSARALARLGLDRVVDLAFHLPTGLVDRRPVESLIGAEPGSVTTLEVEIRGHSAARRTGAPHRVAVAGGGALFELIYFRARGDWLAEKLPVGTRRLVSGRLDRYEDRWQMVHPDFVIAPEEAAGLPPFEPVYTLTEGITQRQMARATAAALARLPELPEWHDPALSTREHWPDWRAALAALHSPAESAAGGPSNPARRRLAADELLSHQLALALARERMRRSKGRETREAEPLTERAAATFGYPPTGAQARALDEIRADMASPERMMRLLQGDVGAGKTWVAAMALIVACAPRPGRARSWRCWKSVRRRSRPRGFLRRRGKSRCPTCPK